MRSFLLVLGVAISSMCCSSNQQPSASIPVPPSIEAGSATSTPTTQTPERVTTTSAAETTSPSTNPPVLQTVDPQNLDPTERRELSSSGFTSQTGAPTSSCSLDANAVELMPVVDEFLNVRSGPGTGSAIVMRLGPGTTVLSNPAMSTFTDGDRWIGIVLPADPGQCAWVHSDFVVNAGLGSCGSGTSFIYGGPTTDFVISICEVISTGRLVYHGARLSDGAAIELPACEVSFGHYVAFNSETRYDVLYRSGGNSVLNVTSPSGELLVNQEIFENAPPQPTASTARC